MKHFLATTLLSSVLIMPAAFAQDDMMTCADFTALDASGQAEALAGMETGMGMDGADAGTTDTMGTEGTDDMAADDAPSDDTATDGAATDDMATDDAAGDDMAGQDGAMTGEADMEMAQAVADVCMANPEMTVEDAMAQAQIN